MLSKHSVIHPEAKIAENVSIGHYSVIGKNVVIGSNCKIHNHVILDGYTEVGEDNEIFSFSVIGSDPQDLKFKGEKNYIKIGNGNKIREYVTINPGTRGGGGITKVGNNCLLMVGTHIAHDCQVGDNVIFANNATLAGHVEVNNNAIIGGLSAIHQFVRIGEGSMIGGMSGIISDVIPYGSVMGNRANLVGLNLIGLKRCKTSKNEIQFLRKFYKNVFMSNVDNFRSRLDNVSKELLKFRTINEIVKFVNASSTRSFCMPG